MLVSGNQGILIAGSSLDAAGNLGLVSTNGNIAITASQDQTDEPIEDDRGCCQRLQERPIVLDFAHQQRLFDHLGQRQRDGRGRQWQCRRHRLRYRCPGRHGKPHRQGRHHHKRATDNCLVFQPIRFEEEPVRRRPRRTTLRSRGQTGVNIASTGGNVSTVASDGTAGDAHPHRGRQYPGTPATSSLLPSRIRTRPPPTASPAASCPRRKPIPKLMTRTPSDPPSPHPAISIRRCRRQDRRFRLRDGRRQQSVNISRLKPLPSWAPQEEHESDKTDQEVRHRGRLRRRLHLDLWQPRQDDQRQLEAQRRLVASRLAAATSP